MVTLAPHYLQQFWLKFLQQRQQTCGFFALCGVGLIERRSYDLFLGVLVGAEQVDGLHVSEVDVVAQQENEEQLADVLLLAVAVQRLVALELGADVGQLLVDPLDLRLLAFTWCHRNNKFPSEALSELSLSPSTARRSVD